MHINIHHIICTDIKHFIYNNNMVCYSYKYTFKKFWIIVITQRNLTRPGTLVNIFISHDDVIKWKYFPRHWPFVRGIHRSPVNSPHKGQWRRALMFSLICAKTNGWVNNRDAGDLRCHHAHFDVTVIIVAKCSSIHRHRCLWKWFKLNKT